MRVLPDTSIWVGFLRQGADGDYGHLDDLLERGAVVVCGPVLAELLAGTAANRRGELWLSVATLPWAEIDRAAWRQAGEIAAELRTRGETVPLTDVVIGVAAARAEARLWSRDEDFERIRDALPALDLYAPPHGH